MKHYVLVGWPEIQDFMLHDRWNECIFCIEIEGHPVGDSIMQYLLTFMKR